MRRAGPVALLGASAALAAAGVGLLLPPGRSGGAAAGDTARPSVVALNTTAMGGGGAAPAAVTIEPAGSMADDSGTPTAALVPPPADRLAGPVPDDEIAVAFAAAVPAAENLDPAVASEIIVAAGAGLISWYAAAGWRDVRVQAAVVTDAGASTASVAALWSGDHPVLGSSDRRYSTVSLTSNTPVTDDPGTTWTVDSIEGGAGDG